jgi:hypothetical protein
MMCKKHVRTFVIAPEPSFGIFEKADRSDWAKLFSLLDFVQSYSGAISEWGGENGPIAKRAWADLVSAAHPSQD